ncbi:hypothetical protein [Halorubrum sp. AJ67]|uniref:hypothetical protein n=1 Tax=Halorubrum sp. AJ67 TaxID=1173487 RepID=UPI0003DD3392|nr:hypothetical protein [Halorubrum sp. AJ67]CDK38263.1 uncharacterized protein domain protein [Halorubrum sp. AJ67]
MSTRTSTPPSDSGVQPEDHTKPADGTDSGDESSPANSDSTTGREAFDIAAEQQMTFGDSGELEPAEDAITTTLDQFDVDVDKRERESRLDRPEATGLLCDDRPEVTCSSEGEQANLFADAEEDQQTLSGDNAANQSLF